MEVGLPDDLPAAEGLLAAENRFHLLVDSVQDYAIFMVDPNGIVLSWNAGAQRLKGYAADEIIGQSFEVFYPAQAVADGWPREELRLSAANGRVEDEGWRIRRDGSRFWASVVITALRDPAGRLLGHAKVTRDLTERRAHEEALVQSEEQLRLLVGAVQDYALFMLSPQGEVLTWNAGAERITGYAAPEVVGRHFSMFFTSEAVSAGIPAHELEVARRSGRAEAEGWRVRKGGEAFWANAVITPVLGPDGKLRGFAKVTRDLSEQRRMMELEQSSRRMEEFLAMLAHELRNPLAPLRNAVQVMKLRGGLPPYMDRVTALMDRQTAQLTRLVDDLLDVARITTGKIALLKSRLDLRDVVSASLEAIRPQAVDKGLRLQHDVPSTPLEVIGDASRLMQALQNLLSNAVRYTPAGGEVRVLVARRLGAMVIEVSDTGIGLSPGAEQRIFNLFSQERVARDPSDSGLGIGLSLARRVAELHGGRLTARSPGPGLGSTFTLLIPAGVAAAPAVLGTDEAHAVAAAQERVLVIDDNADSTDSMVTLLGLLGHVAHGACSGGEGLTAAEVFRPHVVLLDLNMPDLDGVAVMQALRRRFGAEVRIIAMTGYGRQGERRSTLEAGFDAHLTKPVEMDQLQRLLSPPADGAG
jgi:PAS domain S-box-containing protein